MITLGNSRFNMDHVVAIYDGRVILSTGGHLTLTREELAALTAFWDEHSHKPVVRPANQIPQAAYDHPLPDLDATQPGPSEAADNRS